MIEPRHLKDHRFKCDRYDLDVRKDFRYADQLLPERNGQWWIVDYRGRLIDPSKFELTEEVWEVDVLVVSVCSISELSSAAEFRT